MTTTIGLIGGTGDLGRALALHLSRKHPVTIGSRREEKARDSVEEIIREKGERDYLRSNLKSGSNEDAVLSSSVVIATVPHENALETMKSLAPHFKEGQLLISAAAVVSKVGSEFVSAQEKPSITEKIRAALPSKVAVASAFQTLPASMIYKEREISADVLVCAEDFEIFKRSAEIISSISGLRALYLGTLDLAGELEALTALLLNVGVKNKLKSPTLKINSF